MNFEQRIGAFEKLGLFMGEAARVGHPKFEEAYINNNWFTSENISMAFTAWASVLTGLKLRKWLSVYQLNDSSPKNIAIIMAGNIPLVGFHDLLCVLITGNRAIVKMSDDDKILPKLIMDELIALEQGFNDQIVITEERLPKDFDAVIATGSNNTNRYFEYYFRSKPSLLRKGRSSIAVISGHETPEELHRLADDIFLYFGLGCRNVSKLYVPEGYDMSTFFEHIEFYKNTLLQHHKYTNNYHYHKAIFLMNLAPHLDNNFVVLKEDEQVASPLGTLFYEYYKTADELMQKIEGRREDVQCIVSKLQINGAVTFGSSQQPGLWDYADGLDTIDFLLSLQN